MFTYAISLLACGGTVILALLKPQVRIRDYDLSIFYLPALLGAIALLFWGAMPCSEVLGELTAKSDINPLKILALFLSMTLLSIYLDNLGFFRYLANIAVQHCGGSQLRLFAILYAMVSILTIFTSNDVIILTFTPFICYFAKNTSINPIPYLVAEFVAANTASMFLIIGNPTNIYIATMAGIDFFSYVKVMAIPVTFAIFSAFLVLYLLFRKSLQTEIKVAAENVVIEQKLLLVYGLVVLAICTILLSISGFIQVQMWKISVVSLVALLFGILAISAVKHRKPTELLHTLYRTPWEVIPLVISMFIIVISLENSGFTLKVASFLNSGNTLFTYGVGSTLCANLINNIPMSVLFSAVLSGSADMTAIYASIIGSNIGAYLTPIGALAGVMWLGILRTKNIDFTFSKFVGDGLCVATPTLMVTLLMLRIVM
ncbi:MAG: SLC13 family permease [Candidatus Cloacimonetes bacterium]|nr:SLC13 family permease [Candidatus Cloacimonadota bacterium]